MTNTIEQIIKNVDMVNGVAWVTSKTGKTYPVEISDKVRMTMNPTKDDLAIIRIIGNRWIMIDVKKKAPVELMVKQDPDEWDILLGGY